MAKWRQAQTNKSLPFEWNGLNYLVKVPSDLDYLCDCKPLISWLGFSLTRNPFIVPMPLGSASEGTTLTENGLSAHDLFDVGPSVADALAKSDRASEGFVTVGALGNVEVPSDPSTEELPLTQTHLSETRKHTASNPYSTVSSRDQCLAPRFISLLVFMQAIINDPSVLPTNTLGNRKSPTKRSQTQKGTLTSESMLNTKSYPLTLSWE